MSSRARVRVNTAGFPSEQLPSARDLARTRPLLGSSPRRARVVRQHALAQARRVRGLRGVARLTTGPPARATGACGRGLTPARLGVCRWSPSSFRSRPCRRRSPEGMHSPRLNGLERTPLNAGIWARKIALCPAPAWGIALFSRDLLADWSVGVGVTCGGRARRGDAAKYPVRLIGESGSVEQRSDGLIGVAVAKY
jgi:hypothetical protein